VIREAPLAQISPALLAFRPASNTHPVLAVEAVSHQLLLPYTVVTGRFVAIDARVFVLWAHNAGAVLKPTEDGMLAAQVLLTRSVFSPTARIATDP